MAKITGVGRGKGDFPERRVHISAKLSQSRDHTKKVAEKVRLVTGEADFSATLGPIGNPSKALRVAKRNMLKFRLY